MNFVGAAQQIYNSFIELARSMMDTYCHNWNNPLDPRSYILPPIYSFKHADKSDQDINQIKIGLEQQKQAGMPQKALDSGQRPVIDRCSENGEFVVFNALWALIQDKVAAPFLAIHGLNLDSVRRYLRQIFPLAQVDIEKKFEAMMREYDFVLIGPKIGLIVIEVKSSHYTKKKDFTEKSEHLPEDIIKALKQLGSFTQSFFHVCSGSASIPIRKILFTPNLKKDRFETWINNFDREIKKHVMDNFDGVTHWFSEDIDNECDQKPYLYTVLREEIEKTGYQILHEIFESYGLIISGIRSAVVQQIQTITRISTDCERLSISNAILKDAAALESHNPKRQPLDKSATNVVEVESKLVLLTPEQQKALYGPNRQFIIGAPGTGKTIILQAKISQLLKEGKNVVIYAEEPYNEKYKKLFAWYGPCEICVTNQRTSYFPQLKVESLKKRMPEDGTLTETLAKLSEHIRSMSMVQEDLRDFDAIFIDDAFDSGSLYSDWKSSRIYESISLMAVASTSKFRSKFVWVACDAYFNDSQWSENEVFKRMLNEIIRGEQGDYFSTTVLNRVMRSSESVFQATYSNEVTKHLATKPAIGHKIHGFYDSVQVCNLSLEDTYLEIWKHSYSAVKKFKENGFGYGHMAILIGGDQFDLRSYLWDKFSENGIPFGNNVKAWDSPGLLTLDEWRSVSSFEWPVVIYIDVWEAHEKLVSYNRYRACSRATMNLFEIIADVEFDLESVEFYRGHDGLYVVVFLNRPKNPINTQWKYEGTEEEELACNHGGKLFKSILGRYITIYRIDLKEIPGVCTDFLELLSPTDHREMNYLYRRKKEVPLTLDSLEYYCRRGNRLDLVEYIVKAKKT